MLRRVTRRQSRQVTLVPFLMRASNHGKPSSIFTSSAVTVNRPDRSPPSKV